MTKPVDDLEAVRTVVEAMQGFKEDEQQRIFRWSAEKLGLRSPFGADTQPTMTTPASPRAAPAASAASSHGAAPVGNVQDIRSFFAEKNPRSDVQFAATVAYYYQFEAPQAERKKCINKDDLQEATRKTGRDRLALPAQTLRNAHAQGLLDKGDEAGTFCINTVGENLVAMTLPGDADSVPRRQKKSAVKKTAAKRSAAKSTKRSLARKKA